MMYVPQIQYKTKVLMDVPISFKYAEVARAIQSAEIQKYTIEIHCKKKVYSTCASAKKLL